jgi:hypothetical protein
VILNGWVVGAAFVAAVSGAVALAAAVAALRSAVAATRGALRAETPRRDEDREARAMALGALLATTAIVLRCLAIPIHYAVLESYVPALAERGVMCAYGASEVQRELVLAVELSGPLAVFALGAWLVRARAAAVATRRGPAAWGLVLAGLLAVAASGVELAHLFADKGTRPVSCCSTLTGATAVAVAGGARLIASPFSAPALFVAVQAISLALAERSRRGRGRGWALAAFAPLQLAVAVAFGRDVLAPEVLGLPYHRCAYELVTGTLALGPAALFALAAALAAAWTPFAVASPEVSAKLARAALTLQASALLLVALHVM